MKIYTYTQWEKAKLNEAIATAALLEESLGKCINTTSFFFYINIWKRKTKNLNVHIGKKKQVEVQNSCKNCWTNSSFSLKRVTRIGSSSTFVLHGKLKRKRHEKRETLLAEGRENSLGCCFPTSTMRSGTKILLAGVDHHHYSQGHPATVQFSPKSSMERHVCYSLQCFC